MRRKIALFANGWGNECLREVGLGLQKVAGVNDIDIFAFVNHVSYSDPEPNKLGEFNIFTLPNMKDFDGAVCLANSFNTDLESNYVTEAIGAAGIPAISVEARMDGMDYFGSDDYQGMSEVIDHLISEHKVKDFLYIGGIKGHAGDEIRKKAVMETTDKYGISVPDENYLTGDFAAVRAVEVFSEWRKSHTLPEAIICANDVMAIGICDYLKEEKISVPEDVIVTGYDCLKAAGEYNPSITSVNSNWIFMGQKIMENLLAKMDGKETPGETILGSRMIVGESCGCVLSNKDVVTWKNLREKSQDEILNGFSVDRHFRHMFLYMRKIISKEDMNRSLSLFFLNEGWLEGNDVLVALMPDFFDFNELTEENRITWGFPETMDAVCCISNRTQLDIRRLKTSNIIYELSNRSDRAGVYIFIPIRSDLEMYGFVAMTKGFNVVQNDVPYIWSKHMSQYMELVKSNIAINHLTQRLEALSVTDGLTGVYNRAGCETIIYSKVRECQEKGGQAIVMLADVDRLKKINDKYGHGAGDVAITTAISLLKKKLPKGTLIGRFGGDEFLIAVTSEEKIDIDAMTAELMNEIAGETTKGDYQFKISVSIGGIQMEPGATFDIREVLPKMDEKVYKYKEIHHKEDDLL